jgi:hypothetical protein
MSGINQTLFTAVCRIKVRFQDDIGNQEEITGTGFWVKDGEKSSFVTNKHNVDPTLKLGPETTLKLNRFEVQLRQQIGDSLFSSVSYFPVQNLATSLRIHQSADVAIFYNPSFEAPGYGYNWFSLPDLATADFLSGSVSAMDIASFIRYPGLKGKAWWDEQWQLAVARVVNIASWPAIPFTNSGIKTSDVLLVSGLSFSGSSGSPIILHQKGVKAGNGLQGGNYIGPKVLGIMSGHWWGHESPEDLFFHSGLSYFTRSTAIMDLLTI